MTEDDAADGPGHKADRKGRVSEQSRHDGITDGEVEFVQHDAGDDTVKKEVIPFYGGANQ